MYLHTLLYQYKIVFVSRLIKVINISTVSDVTMELMQVYLKQKANNAMSIIK